MAANIGSLIVELAANTAAFQADMGRAAAAVNSTAAKINRSLSGIEKGFSQVTRAVGAFGVGLSIGALVAFTKQTLDTVGGLGELAEQIGVSTDALQAYQYAAIQSGIKSETLEKGLSKLTRTIGEARDGSSDAVGSIRAFGSTVESLVATGASTEEVLRAVADRIASTEDPAKRAALAAQLFGDKVGQKLLPILSGGAAGLDDFIRKAKESGQVIDKDLIERFDRASDRIEVWKRRFTIGFAEALDSAANVLENPKYRSVLFILGGAAVGGRFAGAPGALFGASVGLGAALGDLTSQSEVAQSQVDELRASLATLTDELYQARVSDAPPPVIAALEKAVGRAQNQLNDAITKVDQLKQRQAGVGAPEGQANGAKLISRDEQNLIDRLQAEQFAIDKSKAEVLAYTLAKEKDAQGNPKYTQAIIDRAVAIQKETDLLMRAKSANEEFARIATENAKKEEDDRLAAKQRAQDIINQRIVIDEGIKREISDNQSLIDALNEGSLAYEEQTEYLRIANQYRAAGIPLVGEEIDKAREQAKQIVQQNRALDLQKQSMDELANFADRAFDRIGSAITEAYAQGETAAMRWGNVARAVLSEVYQEFFKLLILNPAKNALFDQNNPTWSSVFGKVGGGVLNGGGTDWFSRLFSSGNPTAGASSFVSDFSASAGFSSLQMGFADGTLSATPGWHLVGEEGPELVKFSGGQQVFTNADTMNMLRPANDRKSNVINFNFPPGTDVRGFMRSEPQLRGMVSRVAASGVRNN